MSVKKIAHFTNIAPHYREALWYKILSNENHQYHFFFGKISASGIKSINFDKKKWRSIKTRLHHLKNVRLLGRLIFQIGVLNSVLFKKWDAVILLGDMNVISSWLSMFILKIKKTPVLTWGHGMYGDERGLKKVFRVLFHKTADFNLVYGHWAKKQLLISGIEEEKIDVIYNSLDYQESRELRDKVIYENYYQETGIFKNEDPVLIFVGRLTPQKNIGRLLQSVNELTASGTSVNTIIVGDGSEKAFLEREAAGMDNVHFFGACYDEITLAKLIANSDLCVSPGNVGLTAIHSLSYGTPVCTHDNFVKQMPEFEAIREGKTGCFFDWDKGNIADTIKNWLYEHHDRNAIRNACYDMIDHYYNPQNQMAILNRTIDKLLV